MEHSTLEGDRLLIVRLDSKAELERLLAKHEDGPDVVIGPIEIAIRTEKNEAKATVLPGTALKIAADLIALAIQIIESPPSGGHDEKD